MRGNYPLFRNLSFDVSAGEVLAVEGPNGVGKTSLLRAVAGFLAPSAGRIVLQTGGKSVDDPEGRAQFIGWLGHYDGIKAQLTPLETLKFFASYFGGWDVEDALQRFGLKRVRNLPVQYLSAGQKKRLVLARLATSRRPLWLLDEPLSSLDAAGRTLAASVIEEHRASGGIVIAATHEPLGVPCRSLQLATA